MPQLLRWLYRITGTIFLLALLATVGLAGTAAFYGKSLPDHLSLLNYQPTAASQLYASDGTVYREYARHYRIFKPIQDIPLVVQQAFIAAEDRSFYSHNGIDIRGLSRAMIYNIQSLLEGDSLQGASTITQQVAKNILLSHERTLTRKIKEMVLAYRMTRDLTKEHILELYLNEIYLGAGAYGVAAASHNYFNKPLDAITLDEAALLAALPKAPSGYNPWNNPERAIQRRNWVLQAMQEEGFIAQEDRIKATKTALTLQAHHPEQQPFDGEYFAEAAYQSVTYAYGQDAVYDKGLLIHTTLDPTLQSYAESALRRGLEEYDKRYGYRGALTQGVSLKYWRQKLNNTELPTGAEDKNMAVVLSFDKDGIARIGLKEGKSGYIDLPQSDWFGHPDYYQHDEALLQTGDIILVIPDPHKTGYYHLSQIPEVNGALVALDPHNGAVRALVGGYDAKLSIFNRATQAKRQPGSAFKPFVYLAALEAGYSPANLISDEPISFTASDPIETETIENNKINTWKPRNYSGNFYGPTTLRRGVEKSLNVMTIHLALATGIDPIINLTRRLGIYSEQPPRNMSTILGAAETDLLSLTSAYAMIANGGKQIIPHFVTEISSQKGLILAHTPPHSEAIDPRHAYQITSILQGVVERGTAQRAKILGVPIAGKTGTTNNSIDSWFVGFSSHLAVGVYVGYDIPQTLGNEEEGATIALPIFIDFMQHALADQPSLPFPIPKGITLTQIDRNTGFLPHADSRKHDVIWEAFTPEQIPTQEWNDEGAPLPTINHPSSHIPPVELPYDIRGIY